jgi:hypothetical protein
MTEDPRRPPPLSIFDVFTREEIKAEIWRRLQPWIEAGDFVRYRTVEDCPNQAPLEYTDDCHNDCPD